MKDPVYNKYLEKFHLEVCVVFHPLFIYFVSKFGNPIRHASGIFEF